MGRDSGLHSTKPISEPFQEEQESAKDIRLIYCGIWAERLENNQELPLGGSIFSKELTKKLELDFMVFDEEINNFTEEKIRRGYEENKKNLMNWIKQADSDIDPYTYFLCFQVQQKVHELLMVDLDTPINLYDREEMYRGQKTPRLSELKGKTACAERAALGQYLLQKAGVESAYVSGITMQNVKNIDEFPEAHSFIVLQHPTEPGSTLIFDIARPRSQHNVPRVLETEVPFTYELLQDKKELFVGATEVLQGGKIWFGVGEEGAGQHKTVERSLTEID